MGRDSASPMSCMIKPLIAGSETSFSPSGGVRYRLDEDCGITEMILDRSAIVFSHSL